MSGAGRMSGAETPARLDRLNPAMLSRAIALGKAPARAWRTSIDPVALPPIPSPGEKALAIERSSLSIRA